MRVFLLLSLLLLTGCKTREVYIEKNSEALSQAVYASDDSVKAGRFDLTGKYTGEATRLITPPKQRIPIKPIQKKFETKTINPTTGKEEIHIEWKNYALIPEDLRDKKVVLVGTKEYADLLQDAGIALQLEMDVNYYKTHAQAIDKQLQVNEGNLKALIDSNNELQVEKERLSKIIAQRNLTIFGLIVGIGVAIATLVGLLYFKILRFGI